jgi:hypothetical protein
VLAWADAHYDRTGAWPTVNSGNVAEAPGERWDLIDHALRQGHRGLPTLKPLAAALALVSGQHSSRWQQHSRWSAANCPQRKPLPTRTGG